MIHVQNRELVVPGQWLAEGDFKVKRGAYMIGNKVFSSVVGLADIERRTIGVIALEGCYEPTPGDDVIGIVADSHLYGWVIDLNSPYQGELSTQDVLGKRANVFTVDLNNYFRVGDLIFAKVREVTALRRVELDVRGAGYGKLKGGKLVEITPVKIPRVLGRRRSMLNMIQSVTGCTIKVGQNGRVVIMTGDERKFLAIAQALRMIEREAHTTGLTDRIKAFLDGMMQR